jgi:thioredoxin 2
MTLQSYIIRCVSCGTRNRIPGSRVGDTAKCGRCGSAISTQALTVGNPIIVTDSDFHAQVIQSPLPVLLDCWAPWCGPCQMMEPFMDELAADWKGRIRVCKMNVDENQRTSNQFRIQSIPTLLVFDNGELKNTLAGALPKHSIVQAMSPFLKS